MNLESYTAEQLMNEIQRRRERITELGKSVDLRNDHIRNLFAVMEAGRELNQNTGRGDLRGILDEQRTATVKMAGELRYDIYRTQKAIEQEEHDIQLILEYQERNTPADHEWATPEQMAEMNSYSKPAEPEPVLMTVDESGNQKFYGSDSEYNMIEVPEPKPETPIREPYTTPTISEFWQPPERGDIRDEI